MAYHAATAPAPDQQALTRGKSIGMAVVQLLLVPVLFFVGFAFMFVGMGLSAESETINVQDVFVLALYAIVMLTVPLLLIGAPTLLVARKVGRHRLERRAAFIPLACAAASTVIVVGLWIAGSVFDQLAGI